MDTWFQVKEIPQVARATTGSRPGTSLADYMFSVLYMKTLADIQHQLYQIGLLLDLGKFDRADIIVEPASATTSMTLHKDVASDSTYADDSGFFHITRGQQGRRR